MVTRTSIGRLARITYPTTATVGDRLRVKVRLGSLRDRTPKQTYRRYLLVGSLDGSPWKSAAHAFPSWRRTVSFNLTTPTTPGAYRLRLELRRPHRQPPLRTRLIRVNVHEAPVLAPQGDPNDWTSVTGTNADGTVVRWNPCEPIRWAFNANGTEAAYPQALADTEVSLARISANTGLQFQYVGPTSIVSYGTTTPVTTGAEATADLFIGFARSAEVPLFTKGVIGLGGPIYYRTALDKTRWVDTAGVVFNTAFLDATDTTAASVRTVWRSLITHEVLHGIGLGHAAGEQQIMYPLVREMEDFGAGDITGMQVLGSGHGCANGFPDRPAPTAPSSVTAALVPAPPVVDEHPVLLPGTP